MRHMGYELLLLLYYASRDEAIAFSLKYVANDAPNDSDFEGEGLQWLEVQHKCGNCKLIALASSGTNSPLLRCACQFELDCSRAISSTDQYLDRRELLFHKSTKY